MKTAPRCLKKLEHGDTLGLCKEVWKLDRLGRRLRDLMAMLDSLRDRGVKFRSLTEAIDTTTPMGRAKKPVRENSFELVLCWDPT